MVCEYEHSEKADGKVRNGTETLTMETEGL